MICVETGDIIEFVDNRIEELQDEIAKKSIKLLSMSTSFLLNLLKSENK